MLRLIAILTALVFAAPAAHADAETVRNRFVSVLQEDGYGEIRISRTLLGRMRFVATRSDSRREIVVNPNSGVVLRDYVRLLNRSPDNSSGSDDDSDDDEEDEAYEDDEDDRDDKDDDDRHDDDDRDDDDDNSGSGSSNSGSGSSNSGSGSDDDDD